MTDPAVRRRPRRARHLVLSLAVLAAYVATIRSLRARIPAAALPQFEGDLKTARTDLPQVLVSWSLAVHDAGREGRKTYGGPGTSTR